MKCCIFEHKIGCNEDSLPGIAACLYHAMKYLNDESSKTDEHYSTVLQAVQLAKPAEMSFNKEEVQDLIEVLERWQYGAKQKIQAVVQDDLRERMQSTWVRRQQLLVNMEFFIKVIK